MLISFLNVVEIQLILEFKYILENIILKCFFLFVYFNCNNTLGLTPVHLLCEKKLTVMLELMKLYRNYDQKCIIRERSYAGANVIGTSF